MLCWIYCTKLNLTQKERWKKQQQQKITKGDLLKTTELNYMNQASKQAS